MKKKLLTMTLAMAMAMNLSVTAFAATGSQDSTGGSTSIDVKAKYSDSVAVTDVISVNIAWDAMEFTYSTSGTKTWNASSHTYTESTASGWTETNNTIKVTNHSNVDVLVGLSFDALETYNTVSGAFYVDGAEATQMELAAGEEGKPGEADSETAALKLSGTLSSSLTDSTKVGTITVAISKKN